MITLTRDLAWRASTDAGNAPMRRAGRMTWNADDYNEAARVFDELWPPERDLYEAAEQEN